MLPRKPFPWHSMLLDWSIFSGHGERLGGHTQSRNFWRPFSVLLVELSWALANKSSTYCFEP
jgi:hypothetical protein